MENQQLNLCACCANTFAQNDSYCISCGYPLQGTNEQQENHIANRAVKEIDLIDLNKKVETACNSLYWIAGIIGVSSIIGYFTLTDEDDVLIFLITTVIMVGAFLALAVWSKTKPTTALISGLSLYVIIQLLNLIADPSSIIRGIIFKIIIIVYLIKGVMAVLEAEKIKKELNIK
ncbi:hypothetical protein FA048_19225 [Pedobacter polaris]|uniref:Zinc ribbon domain-containing protein n=1 Tax=Pedobacter polaris TaxID=2571273 RepID=A0A4U1CFW6_9SPHI|nr:hypothetical protein [Pedobacter polaris]TKC04596.1 hypothetical protein FA048_19225 [Pedobacter polaris]